MMKHINKKNITTLGIFLAIILGYFFPSSSNVKIILPYLLASILFFNFVKLEFKLKNFIHKEILYYPIISFLIVPMLVFFITKNFSLDLRVGFFLIAISPTAIASPIVTDLINGNRELNIAIVVFSNILAPISCSLLLLIYFNTNNIELSALTIFSKIALIIFAPMILSFFIKQSKKAKSNCIKFSNYYNPITFITIIAIAVSSSSEKLRSIDSSSLIKIFIITGCIAILFFIIGFSITKNFDAKKSFSVSLGQKNSALTVWIALSNFNSLAVLPVIAYIFFHHTINAILIAKYHE